MAVTWPRRPAGVGHAAERSDRGEAYDEIKKALEKGTSALVLVAAIPTVEEFAAAFEASALARAVEREITEEEATQLAEALESGGS